MTNYDKEVKEAWNRWEDSDMATHAEVIYCKNCVYCEKVEPILPKGSMPYLECHIWSKPNHEILYVVDPFDFCSRGKRKVEE